MIRILVLERGRQSRRRKGDLWWRERGRSGLFLRACSQGSPQGAGTPRGPKGGTLTEDLRPRWLACLSLFPFPFPFCCMAPVAQRKFRPPGWRPGRPEKKADLQRGGPSPRGPARPPKRGWAGDGQGSWGKVGSREATTRAAPGPSPGPCRCRPIPPCSGQQRWSDASAGARELPLHHPLPSDSASWNRQAFRLAGPFFETSNLHRHPHHSTTSTTHHRSHTDRSRPSSPSLTD